MLAHAYLGADIDAVDLSADALTVAQRNVSDYGLAGRINLIRSDLFANLRDKRYDLIISNPPYVTATSMAALPAEYLHEPTMALAGGADGLDAVRSIVEQAGRCGISIRAARWSWKSAPGATPSRRRSRSCRSCGSPRPRPRTACSC